MAHHRNALAVLGTLLLSAALLHAQDGKAAGSLQEGIALYKNGLYDKAIIVFRAVTLDGAAGSLSGDATLWIAKSYLALGKLEDAARNVETYLSGYPKAADRAEGIYQKGRILFLQDEFESALQVLQGFITTYPQSALVSSAYFWAAESMYALGRLDEAASVYRTIVREYPTSFKVEAAQYKLSLIDIARREVELSKLLKWSHEEFLHSLEDFQRREKTYEQAIDSYQKRLGANESAQYQATIADLRRQLEKKTAEAAALASQVREQKDQAGAGAPAAAATEAELSQAARDRDAAARTLRLLAVKQAALAIKQSYLEWLLANGGQQ
jgi:TolA-binding protein